MSIILRFIWNEPYGQVDPIFGRDIGFYLFHLPFWEMIQTSLTVLVFMTLVGLVVAYVLTGLLRYQPGHGLVARPSVLRQVRWNAALWLVLLAVGLYLDRYELLFRSSGIVFGAGYTDVHIELPAIWIMLVLVLLLAVAIAVGPRMKMRRWIPVGAATLAVVWILGRGIIPGMVSQFKVDPNELELETPYLENNIAMTRLAYGVDAVREVDYEADDTLTYADIENNRDAVDNIRLWDPRLLIQTYKQLQEIRLYYEFYSVDNDRYMVNGKPQQMMLAAREISPDLPTQSNTWVNRHLQFTHGYGLVMSPVTETNRQGEPILVIRDVPPVVEVPGLTVERPAIYYGGAGEGYYIVNTGTEELHYPAGDENVYNSYDGEGGIPISNWFRRLLFAWELSDMNILLSDYIHDESRLQIWRGVQDRIRKITPFLVLDRDPYLVVNDGKLYYIQDAYTTSANFPYSQPFERFNYIRNSVKVVVDAFDGHVTYYAVDESDPVLQVYQSIFPNVFRPLSELAPGLEHHFRYPQDLFEVQLEVYNRYHMTRPQVFYNNEDLWTRPFEKYGGQQLRMEPYYVLARLPGEEGLKFMLISPLTPENRDNMISWVAAKSDVEDYGELVVYKLPKQRLIYGPAQIEARIDQDPEISRQLALWDQRGSRVIRGNLMVIPIEDSFLYVEPVFLLAEGVDIPQLQRVIVAIGEKVVMEPTMDQAIEALFGTELEPSRQFFAEGVQAAQPDTVIRRVTSDQLEEVRRIWRELQNAFEAGDWRRYGELMENLDEAVGE